MSCERYLDLISARLDGELTQGEETELQAHLSECPACRAIARDLDGVHSAVAGLGEVEAPEELSRRVMEGVRAQKRSARRRMVRRAAGVAACLVLCVGLYRLTDGGKSTSGDLASGGAAPAQFVRSAADEENMQSDLAWSHADKSKTAALHDVMEPAAQSEYETQRDSCTLENERRLRVTWGGGTQAPAAWVIGSVSTLEELAARFPEDDLSDWVGRYDEDFFNGRRLVAVLVEESSVSVTHALSLQGLEQGSITVLRTAPEAGDTERAAWLLTAEVAGTLPDGQGLNVVITEQK